MTSDEVRQALNATPCPVHVVDSARGWPCYQASMPDGPNAGFPTGPGLYCPARIAACRAPTVVSMGHPPTDLEWIATLLRRAGVVYVVGNVNEPGWHGEKFEGAASQLCVHAALSMEHADGADPDKNRGYSDFLSVFYFDAHGKLRAMGAWE